METEIPEERDEDILILGQESTGKTSILLQFTEECELDQFVLCYGKQGYFFK